MSMFAFIFARGGSKGLPGKNIKPLGGIPLIAHSILVAQQVEGISKVFVSTDSPAIAEVARAYSAEVIVRPDELATDTAAEWQAWRHAIGYIQARGDSFDTFISLPATSPLRNSDDIRSCLASLDQDTDMVVTVTPASRSPYFNMVVRDEMGNSQLVCAGNAVYRRQDAPEVFDMTTVAYVTRPAFVMEHERIFSGRVKSVVVPRQRAVDIDDIYDFRMAEMLYADREKGNAER